MRWGGPSNSGGDGDDGGTGQPRAEWAGRGRARQYLPAIYLALIWLSELITWPY
jgi:hypothetical protein